MALKWYVVHAYSQYEKKVATAIHERAERLGMQDRFGEIIVPTEEVIEMKGGQKRKSELKFFPLFLRSIGSIYPNRVRPWLLQGQWGLRELQYVPKN